jgi:hypothetical protein
VDEPPSVGDERWDALLAAMAEHLGVTEPGDVLLDRARLERAFTSLGAPRGGRRPSRSLSRARHPIYPGLLTALLGTTIVNNLLGLIIVAVLVAYFYYCGTVEERNLVSTFPTAESDCDGLLRSVVLPGGRRRRRSLA